MSKLSGKRDLRNLFKTYSIKINLSGGYAQFVKDFELISRTGALQKYINDKKDELEYIDLSFKNKVFLNFTYINQSSFLSSANFILKSSFQKMEFFFTIKF